VKIVKGKNLNTKNKSTKSSEKKNCIKCLKDKVRVDDFYISYSKLHADGRVPICKECLAEMFDINDPENSLIEILRQVDKPFVYDVYVTSKQENPNNIFGKYMKNIVMHQYKGMTWKDSVFSNNNHGEVIVDESELKVIIPDEDDFNLDQSIINFWGSGYTKEQYRKLQNFKEEMESSYEIETASHKDYLKKICIVSLKMEDALAKDDIGNFKKLSDAYDSLMHSAKFTAVQRSAADRTGGLNTFGEFFEFIEKEGFIPKYHVDEPQDIVDETIQNLMKYTKNLVLGDPNIANIVEATINKINNNEDEESNEDSNDIIIEDAEDEDLEYEDS